MRECSLRMLRKYLEWMCKQAKTLPHMMLEPDIGELTSEAHILHYPSQATGVLLIQITYQSGQIYALFIAKKIHVYHAQSC